jgi:type IV pilus assembly protein PilW
MNQFITTRQRLKLAKQSGIGLIELLVSMLIGLFIMGGVLQLFSTSSQNAVAVSGSSRIQENVRFVFSRIADDISQSGNLGCISSSVAVAGFSVNNPITSQAFTLDGDAFSFLTPVRVSNAAAAEDGADPAPAGGRAPATDEFSIGYVDNAIRFDVENVGASDVTVETAGLAAAGIAVGDIVSVSNCYEAAIFDVTAINTGTGVISHVAGFDKNISSFRPNDGTVNVVSPYYLYGGRTGAYEYSIGKSAAAAAADDCIRGANAQNSETGQSNCALFRTDATSGARQELAQGVHDIQVQYGWTDNTGNLRFSEEPTAAQTALVDRMRVTMAFNSIDNVNTVGNNIDQTAGGLIVKTYSRTFNLFNRL